MKPFTALLASLALMSSSIQAKEANAMVTQTTVSRADIQAVAPLAADPEGNIWYADISGYVGMLPAQYARRP